MDYDRSKAEQKLLNTIVKKDEIGHQMPRDDNSSLRNDCSSLGGTKDFSGEGPGSTCGTKVRYEPHTIQAELRKDRKGKKEFHIRGVFRMDSRFDPTCKPIPD